MSQIIIGQTTGFTDVRKWKNQYWEAIARKTPNEAFRDDRKYRECVRDFKLLHDIHGPNRFYEVRIIKQRSCFLITGGKNWWDTSGLMDHVFWVFQQPLYSKVESKPYGFYVLEPIECKRVSRILAHKYKMPEPEYPGCFIIPTENCINAWHETAAGTSEHVHEREEIPLTQAQIDKEAETSAAADQLIGEALNSPKLIQQFEKVKDAAIGK